MEQPELPLAEARAETLYRLLAVEPDTLHNIARTTGWGYKPTQDALLRLIVEGRASCRFVNQRQLYAVKVNAHSIRH